MIALAKTDDQVIWEGLWTILSQDPDHFSLGKFYNYYAFISKLSDTYDDKTRQILELFYKYFQDFESNCEQKIGLNFRMKLFILFNKGFVMETAGADLVLKEVLANKKKLSYWSWVPLIEYKIKYGEMNKGANKGGFEFMHDSRNRLARF
jgi:hypothetical protein